MTRVAHLLPHVSREEWAQRYRQAPDVVEARRWHLLRLIAAHHTIKEAAADVGLAYEDAKRSVRRDNADGPQTLRNRSREKQPPPPRRLLSPAPQEEVRVAVESMAPDGGMWSGPTVAHWIAPHTGRPTVAPQRGGDYLQRLGHSSRVPRPRHERADPAAHAAFKHTVPPS